MSLTIAMRPGRLTDVEPCVSILNAWIDATDWVPRVHAPDDIARYYSDVILKTHEVTVAAAGPQVVGFISVAETGLVSSLYVAESVRKNGLGAALLGRAKRHYDQLRLWTFEANAGARRFYAREGFVEMRRTSGDNEEGLPDILLHWTGGAYA